MTRWVLVTGSSRGIGKSIALQLASDGFGVVVHCRSGVSQAEETCAEIRDLGGETRLLQFDIADRAETEKIIVDDMDANGAYYGAVANAGIAADNAFPSMTGEEWDGVITTNLGGFYNVIHPIVMPMIRGKKGGRIVTLSSVSGIMGNRGQVNYSAAKAGIAAATKSLAIELAKRKITVNCVAPGLIETDMVSDVPVGEVKKMIPVRRLGKPEEVAGLVGYLFSDNAAYVTRQVISVNGGMF
ncbi:3-oxoacyl-ACP reductase [Gammaproteobacteria bacterium 45_16_T64]|nr:3-oxoacyl-ACP reductase [Gammaproteobacteria bacterium 45_16_T64]